MNRMRKCIRPLLVAAAFGTLAVAGRASAEMIGADDAASPSRTAADRERVKALVARPELASKLQALGLPPQKAQARVDALTDQEVRTLASNLDALPAGGNFTDFQWIMIVIGAVIIALLL